MKRGHGIGLVAASLAAASVVRAVDERRELRRALAGTIGTTTIETDEQLQELHHHLHTNIDPNAIEREARRPILRSRAVDTWRTGEGLCGENARLAITLLSLGDVPANRLYLKGERWEHCMVEAQWSGQWVAFDGHQDPSLQMQDDQIGHIPSDRLELFPNTASRNPWRRAVRFKPLLRLPATSLDRIRPPQIVVRIAESPDLLRGLGLSIVALVVPWIDRGLRR